MSIEFPESSSIASTYVLAIITALNVMGRPMEGELRIRRGDVEHGTCVMIQHVDYTFGGKWAVEWR